MPAGARFSALLIRLTHALRRHPNWSSFATFLLLGILLAGPSLTYPLCWDDLHLVRSFSGSEILGAFHGNWDPDGIETHGYRPITVLFNHLRARLCDDHGVFHRLLLLGLFAAYLTQVMVIAACFGVPRRASFAAGLLVLAAKYDAYHYVWITDGNHLLQACAVGLALGSLLEALTTGRRALFLGAVAGLAMGILIREETLAIVPVMLILGYARARRIGAHRAMRRMHVYAAVLGGVAALLFLARARFLPEAIGVSIRPAGMLHHFAYALSPLGRTGFDAASRWIPYVGYALLGLATAGALAMPRRVGIGAAGLWLACGVATCSPGLTLERTNLLLFPITFFALAELTVLESLWRRWRWARIPVAAMLALVIAGSAHVSRVTAESFHPYSLVTLSRNFDLVYGPDARRAHIPPARRERVCRELADIGIRKPADVVRTQELISEAMAAGRRRPSSRPLLFVPRLRGLYEP